MADINAKNTDKVKKTLPKAPHMVPPPPPPTKKVPTKPTSTVASTKNKATLPAKSNLKNDKTNNLEKDHSVKSSASKKTLNKKIAEPKKSTTAIATSGLNINTVSPTTETSKNIPNIPPIVDNKNSNDEVKKTEKIREVKSATTRSYKKRILWFIIALVVIVAVISCIVFIWILPSKQNPINPAEGTGTTSFNIDNYKITVNLPDELSLEGRDASNVGTLLPGEIIDIKDNFKVSNPEFYVNAKGETTNVNSGAFTFRLEMYLEYDGQKYYDYIIPTFVHSKDYLKSGIYWYYLGVLDSEKSTETIDSIKVDFDIPNSTQGKNFKLVIKTHAIAPVSDVLNNSAYVNWFSAPSEWKELVIRLYQNI